VARSIAFTLPERITEPLFLSRPDQLARLAAQRLFRLADVLGLRWAAMSDLHGAAAQE
jgi:hypothetical protein